MEMTIGYFWCGNGHIFTYGNEDWHSESESAFQWITDEGVPIPTYCPEDMSETDDEPCMDSSHLVGPYDTHEEATESYENRSRLYR